MFRKEVKAYPLCAWLLSAMFALSVRYAANQDWLVVLLTATASLLLCWCNLVLREGQVCERKWYCVIQLVFLTMVTAKSVGWSGALWPTGDTFPVVPLVLLLIAVFSAWHGGERASRASAVVFWLVALLFAVAVTAGIRNVKAEYLIPPCKSESYSLLLVFLFPIVTSFFPREGSPCYTKTLCTAAVVGLIVCILTVGTLSYPVAQAEPFAFYTFSKSLSLFGVAERFEALISVALTMGQYSLLSMLLSGAGHLVETICPKKGRVGVACCAVTAASFMDLFSRISSEFLGVVALLIWGVLPLFTRNTTKVKKTKKFEKTT